VARDKVRDDGHEVFLELGLVGSSVHVLVANHELAVAHVEHSLDELVGDAAQAIPVGNHDLLDASLDGSLQNGEQPAPVEVEAGRNIFHDLVFGIATYEGFALAFEVFFLLAARDADVDDLRTPVVAATAVALATFGIKPEAQHAADVGETVEVLACGASPDAERADFAGLGPLAQRRRADCVTRADPLPRFVWLAGVFFLRFFSSLPFSTTSTAIVAHGVRLLVGLRALKYFPLFMPHRSPA
jgi:hypothetical protein